MRFLIEYDFDSMYKFFDGFSFNLVNHFFSGGYDYDECCCGGSCSCHCGYNIIDYKWIGFILFMVLAVVIHYIRSYNKNGLNYKPKMSDVPLA